MSTNMLFWMDQKAVYTHTHTIFFLNETQSLVSPSIHSHLKIKHQKILLQSKFNIENIATWKEKLPQEVCIT